MNTKLVIIGAGAIGAAMLLEQHGRHAGPSNLAAAQSLRGQKIAGVTFDVPDSASMVAAYASMRRALGNKSLTLGELAQVCTAWLTAYDAGAAAELGEKNYTLSVAPKIEGGVSVVVHYWTDYATDCQADHWEWLGRYATPLGEAICALRATRRGLQERAPFNALLAKDRDDVLRKTSAVADAMDAADYRKDGDRISDHPPTDPVADGLRALPGKISDAIGDVVAGIAKAGLPALLVAAGAVFVIWKVAR